MAPSGQSPATTEDSPAAIDTAELRQRLSGWNLGLQEIGLLIAPLVGAGLVALVGAGGVALLDAGTFAVAATMI